MASRLGSLRSRRTSGFTLIELLVVIAILGVLAAIALAYLMTFRTRAFDARALHDLGNAVTAQEAHFASEQTYATFTAVGPVLVAVPGLVVSATVTMASTGDTEKFEATATSSRGSGKVYHFDSVTDHEVAD